MKFFNFPILRPLQSCSSTFSSSLNLGGSLKLLVEFLREFSTVLKPNDMLIFRISLKCVLSYASLISPNSSLIPEIISFN